MQMEILTKNNLQLSIMSFMLDNHVVQNFTNVINMQLKIWVNNTLIYKNNKVNNDQSNEK